jgi:hypothetical protein
LQSVLLTPPDGAGSRMLHSYALKKELTASERPFADDLAKRVGVDYASPGRF